MRYAETLYAFAQVGVAFAGFAGLMAFVRGRAAGPMSRVHRNSLVGMVRVALIATAFALVPIVVSSQGLNEPTTWRFSAALFAAAFSPITVIAWQRSIFLRKAGISVTVPLIPLIASLALVSILGSVFIADRSAGLYMVGLFLVLLISGALFFSLVVMLLDEGDH